MLLLITMAWFIAFACALAIAGHCLSVREVVSKPHTIEFDAGCPILKAAIELFVAAKRHGSAQGLFNDILLTASPDSIPEEIVAYFSAESDRRAEAYRNSSEGIAAAAASEQRRSDLQAKHDVLMRELTSLNFQNDITVLDWLCEMQEPSDYVGVLVRRETIVSAFEKHSLVANVNCGKDFRAERRDNVFRWLVGQAMDGLKNGPAIHPIIHKFAGEWKEKFCPAPAEAQS